MELASSLRQALDETRQLSFYTNTLNMSWFDLSSRLMHKQMDTMNRQLGELGLTQWVFQEPTEDQKRIARWLELHLENDWLPMVDELLEGLNMESHKQTLPVCTLDPKEIASESDLSWQKRVRAAAKPISCKYNMGGFGPSAHNTDHLEIGRQAMSHEQLMVINRRQAACDKRRVLIDAHSGGCGATVSAIQAGVFVKAAFEAARPEIETFEALTGQLNLGAINQHSFDRCRIPRSHLWWTSSSCKVFHIWASVNDLSFGGMICHFRV